MRHHTRFFTSRADHRCLLVAGTIVLHAGLAARTASAQPEEATQSAAPSPDEATESAAPGPEAPTESPPPEPGEATEAAAPEPAPEEPKQSAAPKPEEPAKRPEAKPEEPEESAAPEAEEGFPLVAVGPQWGIRSPFQVVGIGVGAAVHLPHLLHVTAQLQYGMVFEEDDSGTQSSVWAEATVGYPIEWSSSATLAQADSQSRSRSGNTETVTTAYHNEETETSEMLVLEGGLVTGPQLFGLQAADPAGMLTEAAREYHRVYYFIAGIRYAYAWHGEDRNMNQWWVHAMSPALGLPDEPAGGARGVYTGTFGLLQDDLEDVSTRPVGVKAGGSLMMWKNGFATLDFEVGYMPGPGSWLFTFGNTIPLWF